MLYLQEWLFFDPPHELSTICGVFSDLTSSIDIEVLGKQRLFANELAAMFSDAKAKNRMISTIFHKLLWGPIRAVNLISTALTLQ